MLQRLIEWNERIKHRIHNTRIPIKNKKLLFVVQCCYFFAPLGVGYCIMKYTVRDPDSLRREMAALSPEAVAKIEEHKRKLQADLDAARHQRERTTRS